MDNNLEKNESDPKHKGWTPLLAFICIATTIGSPIPAGYAIGVMNTLVEDMKPWYINAFLLRYNQHLSDSQAELLWSVIISALLIGGICGSLMAGAICNRFGRKGALLLGAFFQTIAAILLNFCRASNSVEMLLIGRFIIGIAAAIIYTAHPIYLGELSPAPLRSSAAVFVSIGVVSGICLGQALSLQQIFGNEQYWQYALSSYVVFVLVGVLPTFRFPESPRWLYLIRHDEVAARAVLERLRGANCEESISAELTEMKALATSNAAAGSEKASLWSVVKNVENLMPLLICCSFALCQQLSGINAIFYYSVGIFMKAGFSLNMASWMNFGAGIMNFVLACVGPFWVGRCGRRPLMLCSAGGCGISLVGMAFALNYIDRVSWMPMLCILFIASFILFFSVGLAPIPYFIGTELFEVETRSVAVSLGSCFLWGGNFIIGMFFPLLQSVWGAYAFLPSAGLCFYCFLLTWCYFPETHHRDVAEVRPLMANGFRSKIR